MPIKQGFQRPADGTSPPLAFGAGMHQGGGRQSKQQQQQQQQQSPPAPRFGQAVGIPPSTSPASSSKWERVTFSQPQLKCIILLPSTRVHMHMVPAGKLGLGKQGSSGSNLGG
eukprot:1139334-Pelagomonas_calceolata.AAC.5